MPATWALDQGGTAANRVEIGGAEYRVCGHLSDLRGSRTFVFVERCTGEVPPEDRLQAKFGFTPAEARVALLLAARKSNREIAAELSVTQHTARRHTEKVMLKLAVHRRTDVQSALDRQSQSHAHRYLAR
jgi:DNA-binding CsgD family transcriptional regulator